MPKSDLKLRNQLCPSPYHVSAQYCLALHIFETELTHVETSQTSILLWVGRMIPGIQLITAKSDCFNHIAAFCDLALEPQLFLQMKKYG